MKIKNLLFLAMIMVFGIVHAQEFSVAQTAHEDIIKELYGPNDLGITKGFGRQRGQVSNMDNKRQRGQVSNMDNKTA